MLQIYKFVFWYLRIKFISVHYLTHASFGYGNVTYFHFPSSNVNFTVQLLTFSSTAIPAKCVHILSSTCTNLCISKFLQLFVTNNILSSYILHWCPQNKYSGIPVLLLGLSNDSPSKIGLLWLVLLQYFSRIHIQSYNFSTSKLMLMKFICKIPFLRTNCSGLLCC